MIKKKLSILLLLLSAVLFIGSFSTSYAVTTDFMENYMTYVNQEVPTTRGGYMVSKFSGQLWQLFKEKYATTCESYDYFLFLFPSSETQGFRVLLWNDNENTGYFDKEYSGQQIGVTETLSVLDIRVPYNATTINNLTDSTRELTWLPAYSSMDIAYYGFYIGDKKVYTNNNLNVVSTKNWVYSNNFSTDKFEFSPITSYFQVCSINGLVEPSEVYVLERPTYDYVTLGYLEKFSNLDNISITRYRYNRANGWVMTSEYATDNFEGYNVQDDTLTYTIDVSKISADTLVIFNFTPKDIETFTNQVFALYIKSPYTYISNSIIYPGQTFSGDYYNNYNDNTNTDKIVDNNNEDSEGIKDFLKDTYDKMFTVSGEEINSIVTNAISKIKIESGELVETTIILDYLNRQPGDFVISWNNMTTHFSIQDQQLDNQLTIPTRQINFSELERNSLELQEVMRWERIIINIGIFSILLHEIYILFLKTIGVGIDIYGDKQEEKATLKAAQQREKATIRRQMFNANQERLREYEKMARKKGWKK